MVGDWEYKVYLFLEAFVPPTLGASHPISEIELLKNRTSAALWFPNAKRIEQWEIINNFEQ